MGNRPFAERIKEHQLLVAEVARLQTELDRARPDALAALPAAYGYASMDSFINAVTQACNQPRQRKTVARVPRVKEAVKTMPAAPQIGGGMAVATQAVQTSEEPPRSPGASLADPKNFGLLPDLSLLETTGGDTRIQQAKLAEALKFTQQVLHTSGVPTAIWREWRQFELKASDLLRTLNAVANVPVE